MGKQRIAVAIALLVAVAAAVTIVLAGGGTGSPPSPGSGELLQAAEEPGIVGEPAAHGGQVEKAIWGPLELPDGSSAFPTYERLGVDVFQIQLRWADVAPGPPADPVDPDDPAYQWPAELDRAIGEASRNGIELAVLVTTTPGWANGERSEIRAPDDVGDYADFLSAAARRYPQVRRWMIWGEPNRSDRFLPNVADDPVGPRRYAELLDAAYGALERASSKNVVIGGNVYTGGDVKPPDFIRWMKLPSGRPPRLDWFGMNPYPFRFPDLADQPIPGGWRDLSDLDTVGEELHADYRPIGIDPPLWLSEFTIQSDQDSRYFAYHVSEEEQALWLKTGYATAQEAGDVKGLGWFTLLDQPSSAESANWGLMTAEGVPKPSFRAYASVAGG